MKHNEGHDMLAVAIIKQACDDYIYITKELMTNEENRKAHEGKLKEIKSFLMSDWCRTLLDTAGFEALDGERIYETLQNKSKKWAVEEPC